MKTFTSDEIDSRGNYVYAIKLTLIGNTFRKSHVDFVDQYFQKCDKTGKESERFRFMVEHAEDVTSFVTEVDNRRDTAYFTMRLHLSPERSVEHKLKFG